MCPQILYTLQCLPDGNKQCLLDWHADNLELILQLHQIPGEINETVNNLPGFEHMCPNIARLFNIVAVFPTEK